MTEETPMQPGSVPIGELEELANHFEDRVEDNKRKSMTESDIHSAIAVGRVRSAQELRNLIREHKHD